MGQVSSPSCLLHSIFTLPLRLLPTFLSFSAFAQHLPFALLSFPCLLPPRSSHLSSFSFHPTPGCFHPLLLLVDKVYYMLDLPLRHQSRGVSRPLHLHYLCLRSPLCHLFCSLAREDGRHLPSHTEDRYADEVPHRPQVHIVDGSCLEHLSNFGVMVELPYLFAFSTFALTFAYYLSARGVLSQTLPLLFAEITIPTIPLLHHIHHLFEAVEGGIQFGIGRNGLQWLLVHKGADVVQHHALYIVVRHDCSHQPHEASHGGAHIVDLLGGGVVQHSRHEYGKVRQVLRV
mmetsp:Transcript_31555/g.82397  ORF Transcript_31555/g.82397 Transcript_31555/m.82397 type:complete len:288 (+) Transcript_31555:34-897(+)